MPSEHAKLSPSAATRWLQCPASIRMTAEHPEIKDESSPYAQEGTVAHGLAEIYVSRHFELVTPAESEEALMDWELEFMSWGYSEEQEADMHRHAAAYLELVIERAAEFPDSEVMVEQRLDTGVPGAWGTSDVVIYSPRHVEIIDYKYGAGVKVWAARNPQLRLYGLGGLDNFGSLLGDVELVRMTVFQPRMDHYDSEELTPEQLRFWREEVVLPKAEEAQGGNARFGPSESACKWCPVAAICRVRADDALNEDFSSTPETLSNEEIGAILERIPKIRAWATVMEQHALDAAFSKGERIPGFKVVLSGGRRTIKDPAGAIQILIDQGFEASAVSEIKTKPLGTLEKIVGGPKKLAEYLGDLVAKTEGKPALVVESDRRKAIDPEASAAEDFGKD